MRTISSSRLLQTEDERTDHVLSSRAAQGEDALLGRLHTLVPGTVHVVSLWGCHYWGCYLLNKAKPHLDAKLYVTFSMKKLSLMAQYILIPCSLHFINLKVPQKGKF